jgi:hypothetical protein
MHWNGRGRKASRYMTETLTETRKLAVSVVDVLAEVRNRHLPNTSQKCYSVRGFAVQFGRLGTNIKEKTSTFIFKFLSEVQFSFEI